jgi:hypothetical protein
MIIGLILALISATAFSADYASPAFQDAHEQYLSVSNEDSGSAKKLAKTWQDIYAQDEKDPLALVLLGSSHTLMGRDAWMPWSKMKHTETGLDEMALAQRLLTEEHEHIFFNGVPVHLEVKMTAAITFTQVPEFFGRQEEGFLLFEDVLSDATFISQPAAAKTYVYYFGISAAKALEKEQLAEQWTNTLIELDIEDDYKQAALALE